MKLIFDSISSVSSISFSVFIALF